MAETLQQTINALRHIAKALDSVTREKQAASIDASTSIIAARKLRVQADLIEQGVPVDVAKRHR